MQFDHDVLPRMADFEYFKTVFENYVNDTAHKALLHPMLSLSRIQDAHFGWRDDLVRITEREPHLKDGPDHFKQSGHLAYWLRRRLPVIDYEDFHSMLEEDNFLYQDEQLLRNIINPYGGEYLAFNFGFQICQFYELNRADRENGGSNISMTMEYIVDVCHLLKFKNVSPHSIYMLYRTLFINK